MTIFSFGYQGSAARDLPTLLRRLGADALIDVRSVPRSRVPGFGSRQLAEALGALYEYRGDVLGGRGDGIKTAGIASLLADEAAGRRVVLMCQEESPGDCHRHQAIALALLPDVDVLHIYRGEVVLASDLQRAILEDTDYPCDELAAHFVGSP